MKFLKHEMQMPLQKGFGLIVQLIEKLESSKLQTRILITTQLF
jgi:hypothetical protein